MDGLKYDREHELNIVCRELPGDWAEQVTPIAVTAAANLDLEQELAAVTVCGDDLPGQDDVWLQIQPAPPPGSGRELVVYCHPAVFAKPTPAHSTLLPPLESWDSWGSPPPADQSSPGDFSRTRSECFLHHNFLLARDLLQGDLVADLIPTSLTEAFQAAWSVGVDGRLQRSHLPGYELAERRGNFSRLFSTAGVLLPDHWQLFQSLWDGAVSGQTDTLDLVRRLPRL